MREKPAGIVWGGSELQQVAIGIYCGEGASHSWTWLVDCFEAQGFSNLVFLEEKDIQEGALSEVDVFAMGGGDAFAVAEALWFSGAASVAAFIRRGGLYLGFCAGAYLLLKMDEFPLNIFSMAEGKVQNIVDKLPPAKALPNKLFTPYGRRYVLHPVREKILLGSTAGGRELFRADQLAAPLYGGPPIQPGPEEEALAVYKDFTPRSVFLVDESLAREVMLGTVAVCRKKIGEGWIYLFGPHFEHPYYPEANAVLARVVKKHSRQRARGKDSAIEYGMPNEQLAQRVKAHLGDARIVAYALEFADVSWRLGHKVYEPAKILVFLETIWKRYARAAKSTLFLGSSLLSGLEQDLRETVSLLRTMKRELGERRDTLHLAEKLFPLLRKETSNFLKAYFAAIQEEQKRKFAPA